MKELTESEKILINALSIHRTQRNGFALQCARVEKMGITQELIEEALSQIDKRIIHNKNKGIVWCPQEIIDSLNRIKNGQR